MLTEGQMIKIPPKRLAQIFDAMPSKSILIIGDIMLDEYIWGMVERISPEAPVPVVDVREETFRLGGAGNVVRNLSSLNAGVKLFSVIGNDRQGETILNLLMEEGVDADGLIKDDLRRTIVKTRIIAHTQQVVRIDKEDREHISNDNTQRLLSAVKQKMTGADAVILSDYGKGLLNVGLIADIIAEAGKYGLLVSVDPKERNFPHYKNTGIITPNKKELAFGAGMAISSEEDMAEAAGRIFDMLGCKMILATRGAEGMSLFEKRGNVTHIPTAAKMVFDVTGAGDTVISVFTLASASGATPVEAAAISNIAAGMVVGEVGAATVGFEILKHACMEELGG
jgi:rfaE bifunctional protein kinase chain/domain